MKNIQILYFLLFFFPNANATTWSIGATRTYQMPSAVSNLVSDGDIIEIDGETYLGDVAVWYANNLIFRGIGINRAHLEANGNYAEGKAIWVIKSRDCRVENIEFSGCTVPDQNGAGIRQEGQNLTLINCFFHHNEMGILTNNDGISDYVFESCEFANNGYGDGYSHNIYVGKVNSLTMRYCYSHDAKIGHLVKSRAQHNLLYYNRLTGENGDGSYEIDLPNGGLAILIGNIIEQSANSENGGIISFGLEGATNNLQQIALSHNTILNNRFDARFLQYSAGTTQVTMRGNQFLGIGNLLQGSGATLDTSHNLRF
jgi:Right handed beta helix region